MVNDWLRNGEHREIAACYLRYADIVALPSRPESELRGDDAEKPGVEIRFLTATLRSMMWAG